MPKYSWEQARSVPARWKGHLEHKLAKKSKVAPVKNYAAMPYQEIAGFVSQLRAHDEQDMRALELAILCASRSEEVLQAPWSEFPKFEEQRLWVIPAERMKNRKEHRVPLSDAAIAILKKQQAIRVNDFVFPGRDADRVSKNTLLRVLKRFGRSDVTVHGFRSTFSDWCADQTNFHPRIKEMALAHTVAGIEGVYTRTDLLERRRDLMEAWARYCAGGAEVIDFPPKVAQSAALAD